MIHSLYIKNYVLIDELEIDFSGGFTTITGETGAGKSILMGALSLILGHRVDTSVLKLKDAKCVVEGTFHSGKALKEVLEANDLDFEPVTVLRREVAPSGKSRAFVNDTPVNLPLLREMGSLLVDIHSQHQNLQLNDHLYQLEVIDHLADSVEELAAYRSAYSGFREVDSKLTRVREETARLKEELDYIQYQFNELDAAQLERDEMESLEAELQRAEHAEEIRNTLFHSTGLLSEESTGILFRLKELYQQLWHLSKIFNPSESLAERAESVYIELKDVAAEIEAQAERTEAEPGRLGQLQERMDLLFSLMQKHRVRDLQELVALREQYREQLDNLTYSEERIAELEKERAEAKRGLEDAAARLTGKRATAAGGMDRIVETQLKQLGIPHARFRVEMGRREDWDTTGADDVRFLFSANKQVQLEEISRVASGGEVSRLMLCIKSMVSDRKGMPTLIFDEIDAGVSGEIADKVGGIMVQLAGNRQVIAITHLPQVASRGADQLVVYKEDTKDASYTRIRKLAQEERVEEIARMLSGEEITDAALSNARVLLRV